MGLYGEFGIFNFKPLMYKVNYRSFFLCLFPSSSFRNRKNSKSGSQFCEDRNNSSESYLAAGFVPRISVG